MPNLNLKAGAPAPMPGVRPAGKPGDGSGGGKIAGMPSAVFIILVVVIVLGGGYFALNKAGIIGKKKAAPVVVTPPPATAEDTAAAITSAPPENEGLVEFKEKPGTAGEKKEPAKPGVKPAAMSAPSTANSTVSSSMMPKISMSASGRYSVQVSSWSSEQKARIEADVMTRAGFPAFVEKANIGGGEKRFRVYVGRFDTDRAARGSAEKMAHMLEGGYWVVRLSK
ncbi:MAG TPA: SPOR domain-containing protein [Bacteroidota bacterium]|nr:SPOR domain-containing protein [Bacteroidota bacterium]